MRNLINILDLTTEEIEELIAVANDIIANPAKYAEVCKGNGANVLVAGSAFYKAEDRAAFVKEIEA